MYMFRYRRAKKCKACVVNNTNSCATNLTIAQPRNVPPRPNREKVNPGNGCKSIARPRCTT